MAAAPVQLKVEIARKGQESRLRRITCPGDWNTVSNVLNEWAGSGYEVQYTDTDGDVVTVSSEREWQECVRISPQPPLRLRCIGGKKPRSQRGAAPPAEAAQEAPQSAPGEAESHPAESQRDPFSDFRTMTAAIPGEIKSAGQQLLRQLDAATSEMLSQLHSLVPHHHQGVQAARPPCAAGCGYVVTGVHPTHCCRCCSRGLGRHGHWCRRLAVAARSEAAEQQPAEAAVPATEQPAEPQVPAAEQPAEPHAAAEGEGAGAERPEQQSAPQEAPAQAPEVDPDVKIILELGLCDEDAARAVLAACDGSVQRAVTTLLQ
eukprot:TRINITY_DN1809_c0_g1_i3.p1 TRINITY_DN1809_c0_g1~~TRINITY_DN1809_c0_g1_i3.p1  ORF type:complete len:318 (+),score=102.98 TRINITY_DN1809_c0_g1_i3:67-1020(+)